MNPPSTEFVIPEGGTKPRPCSELRSPILRDHGDQIAAESLERIYQTWPEMTARYGQRGRNLTAQDQLWHLNYLDTAAALNNPKHLYHYADWLVRFLSLRGLHAEHIAGAFGFLAEGITRLTIPPEHQGHRTQLLTLLENVQQRLRTKTLS